MTVEPKTEREHNHDSIALPGVTKHNWKSASIRDRWIADGINPGFQPLGETYREATLQDDHPRTGYIITEAVQLTADDILDLNDDGLSVSEVEMDDKPDALAVGVDDLTAERLRSAIISESSSEMAKIFGVPECCRKFIERNRQEDRLDPVYEAACNSPSAVASDGREEVTVEDPYPILNTIWSYVGWQFIDFHPCSYECDNAYDLAVKNGKLMREADVEGDLDALYEMLAQPASWSGYHGLTHVKSAHCIGSYDCDDRWDERKVIWMEEHDAKADGC